MDNQQLLDFDELVCSNLTYEKLKAWAEAQPEEDYAGILTNPRMCLVAKYANTLVPNDHYYVSIGLSYAKIRDKHILSENDNKVAECDLSEIMRDVVLMFDGLNKVAPLTDGQATFNQVKHYIFDVIDKEQGGL